VASSSIVIGSGRADCELAVISAGLHGAVSAGDIDGGFSDEDVATWMETADDPIEEVSDVDD
jgi:hypothetical protein